MTGKVKFTVTKSKREVLFYGHKYSTENRTL